MAGAATPNEPDWATIRFERDVPLANQKGQVRLYVRYGSEPQKLAEDIRVLLKQA